MQIFTIGNLMWSGFADCIPQHQNQYVYNKLKENKILTGDIEFPKYFTALRNPRKQEVKSTINNHKYIYTKTLFVWIKSACVGAKRLSLLTELVYLNEYVFKKHKSMPQWFKNDCKYINMFKSLLTLSYFCKNTT